jgi:hypothetical protein
MQTLAPYSDRFWELRPRRASLKQGVSDEWLTTLGYNVYRPLFTKMPLVREHRWRLISEFIETWHGPPGNSPGCTPKQISVAETKLGRPLPAALREWYERFGQHTGYWQGQDVWLDLQELSIEAGHIHFRTENQSCAAWGVAADTEADDPPVCAFEGVHLEGEAPQEESPTFSAFAVLMLFFEGMWQSPRLGIDDRGGQGTAELLRAHFQRAELPSTYWVLTPVYIWEKQDVFCVESQSDGFFYFAARSEAAVQRLPARLRKEVEWQEPRNQR